MNKRIILASGSPRRRELMELYKGLSFEVIPSSCEEGPHPGLGPEELVKALSREKCADIAEKYPDAIVIGADTIVALDDTVLGKPKTEERAKEMLYLLSGREHQVYTGITVCCDGKYITDAERTDVFFRKLSDSEISAYAATGEPLDKAGAYGIQGIGGIFIEKIQGDYYNVVGLPVCCLGNMLKDLGVKIL